MKARPSIQLQLKPIDKTLEWIGYILLLALWVITIYTLVKAPAIIPVHFDLSGKADGYGKKETILLLALIPTLLFVGLTQLNKYPHLFNYMTTITEANAEHQYRIATRLLRYLKTAIVLIFILIVVNISLTKVGSIAGFGFWTFPLLLVLLLPPIIISIFYSLKR